MKRGSVVGPLLLIAIGVWFLINTMRPDLPLVDFAARFWPFLLIGWGVLRLVEILVWAVRGRALPYSGLSGGEWTLIVFICLAGSGLAVANHYRPWLNFSGFGDHIEFFGHTYDYPIAESKIEAGKASRLLIENLRGTTRVTGADVTEVVVSGHKSVRTVIESDARNAERQSQVELSTQGNQIVIRTNQDRVTSDSRVTADIAITVPRAMSVELRGRNGDVEISGLNGGVEVSSDNASSVRVDNIGGNVRLNLAKSDEVHTASVKGDVVIEGGRGRDIELEAISGEVTINGSYSGDLQLRSLAKSLRVQMPNTELHAEAVPGQIHMDLGELNGANVVGPVRLTSGGSRDVQLEQFTQSLEVKLERGDINLRPMQVPLPKIDARTRNGEVEIALPENGHFEIKATTGRGDVTNDFGGALKTVGQGDDSDGPGGSITGAVGQGPSITVQTDRGSLTVRKDSGVPLTAHNSEKASQERHDRVGARHPQLEIQHE